MSMNEVSAERFAQIFYQYQHAVSEGAADADRLHAVEAWSEVSPSEKSRMIAAARRALLEVEQTPSELPSRCYYAKPGEAEWGC